MKRIEEIKERLAYFPRELRDGGFSDNSLAFGAKLDIEYLLSRLEIAIQALEEYTEDEQHCARCDGMTYDTGNGKIAREALQQIQS